MNEHVFSKEIQIHHKDMVPYVAYYVLAGKLHLIDKSGQLSELGPGEVVGLEEVWTHRPLPYEIRTTPGTALLNIDRSLLTRLRQLLIYPLT